MQLQLHAQLPSPSIVYVSSPRHSTTLRSRCCTALDQQLEPVLQRYHIRVSVLVQFKRVGYDLDTPSALGFVVAHLETDPEVAGVLGHAAEGVHGAVGIGFAVVLEPKFCIALV